MHRLIARLLRGTAEELRRWANILDPKPGSADSSELPCMLGHIGYEFAAAEAAFSIASTKGGSLLVNAFLMHTRSLSDFFQWRPRDKKAPTDVIADEFLGKPWRATRENLNVQQLGDQDVRKAINIQVQHLSVHRCRPGVFEWSEWQERAPVLFQDLRLLWGAFKDSLAKKNPDHHARLKESYEHWQREFAK